MALGLLQLINSSANVIVYSMHHKDFKRALRSWRSGMSTLIVDSIAMGNVGHGAA